MSRQWSEGGPRTAAREVLQPGQVLNGQARRQVGYGGEVVLRHPNGDTRTIRVAPLPSDQRFKVRKDGTIAEIRRTNARTTGEIQQFAQQARIAYAETQHRALVKEMIYSLDKPGSMFEAFKGPHIAGRLSVRDHELVRNAVVSVTSPIGGSSWTEQPFSGDSKELRRIWETGDTFLLAQTLKQHDAYVKLEEEGLGDFLMSRRQTYEQTAYGTDAEWWESTAGRDALSEALTAETVPQAVQENLRADVSQILLFNETGLRGEFSREMTHFAYNLVRDGAMIAELDGGISDIPDRVRAALHNEMKNASTESLFVTKSAREELEALATAACDRLDGVFDAHDEASVPKVLAELYVTMNEPHLTGNARAAAVAALDAEYSMVVRIEARHQLDMYRDRLRQMREGIESGDEDVTLTAAALGCVSSPAPSELSKTGKLVREHALRIAMIRETRTASVIESGVVTSALVADAPPKRDPELHRLLSQGYKVISSENGVRQNDVPSNPDQTQKSSQQQGSQQQRSGPPGGQRSGGQQGSGQQSGQQGSNQQSGQQGSGQQSGGQQSGQQGSNQQSGQQSGGQQNGEQSGGQQSSGQQSGGQQSGQQGSGQQSGQQSGGQQSGGQQNGEQSGGQQSSGQQSGGQQSSGQQSGQQGSNQQSNQQSGEQQDWSDDERSSAQSSERTQSSNEQQRSESSQTEAGTQQKAAPQDQPQSTEQASRSGSTESSADESRSEPTPTAGEKGAGDASNTEEKSSQKVASDISSRGEKSDQEVDAAKQGADAQKPTTEEQTSTPSEKTSQQTQPAPTSASEGEQQSTEDTKASPSDATNSEGSEKKSASTDDSQKSDAEPQRSAKQAGEQRESRATKQGGETTERSAPQTAQRRSTDEGTAQRSASSSQNETTSRSAAPSGEATTRPDELTSLDDGQTQKRSRGERGGRKHRSAEERQADRRAEQAREAHQSSGAGTVGSAGQGQGTRHNVRGERSTDASNTSYAAQKAAKMLSEIESTKTNRTKTRSGTEVDKEELIKALSTGTDPRPALKSPRERGRLSVVLSPDNSPSTAAWSRTANDFAQVLSSMPNTDATVIPNSNGEWDIERGDAGNHTAMSQRMQDADVLLYMGDKDGEESVKQLAADGHTVIALNGNTTSSSAGDSEPYIEYVERTPRGGAVYWVSGVPVDNPDKWTAAMGKVLQMLRS